MIDQKVTTMLPNTITLAVDTANTGTTTDQVYVRFEEQINKSTYRGPGASVSSRNQLAFLRTLAKRSGDFLGSNKPTVKYTRDVSVPNASGSGNVVAPLIVEVSMSLPVGCTDADVLAARQHIVAILDRDDIVGLLCTHMEI